jgi:YebC/PmpR family DNA-binding regulatory protein
MAGHSKWANIKHRKARQDAKKGKIFTVLIKAITVAAKQGGANPEDNSRLRLAVDKALAENMTRDTINRAIARGAGSNEADNVEELTYEGYAPGGVAVVVEVMTDNRNRTAADVRHAFSKYGGNLGTTGSASYLFNRQGSLHFTADNVDKIIELAMELDVEDFEQDDNGVSITTDPAKFLTVYQELQDKGFKPDHAEIEMSPTTVVDLDESGIEKLNKLIDALEDLDDVSSVVTNANCEA